MVLEVGKPYLESRSSYPEGVEVSWFRRDADAELRFFWSGVTEQDIQAFSEGEVELGLFFQSPILLIVFKIDGATEWSDVAYTPHALAKEQLALPKHIEPEEQFSLALVLTDAEDGVVKALRHLTLSTEFFRTLLDCVQMQVKSPYSPAQFNQALDELYGAYPDAAELVAGTLIVEKAGAIS